MDEALSTGKIRHAAIDADIFLSVGGPTGPLVPYLSLLPEHSDSLALLPHAAADTNHSTRVAGAKQAIDQIIDAIRGRKVTNLKGDLPDGYVLAASARGENADDVKLMSKLQDVSATLVKLVAAFEAEDRPAQRVPFRPTPAFNRAPCPGARTKCCDLNRFELIFGKNRGENLPEED
ncbi:hypothetical protein FLX27_13395 [Agrobacterium tumefaciens]|nr:hypothetical protein FLX27_13395 [Agrobacterium tumefaciens]